MTDDLIDTVGKVLVLGVVAKVASNVLRDSDRRRSDKQDKLFKKDNSKVFGRNQKPISDGRNRLGKR